MENNELENRKNYIKNIKTSRGRTLRVELVGELSREEWHFLDGISFFAAGIMSKNSRQHIIYVSGVMSRVIKSIILKTVRDGKYADEPKSTPEPVTPALVGKSLELKEAAGQLKYRMNSLAKNVGDTVVTAVEVEKLKGTRPDVIFNITCGALAFTLGRLHSILNSLGGGTTRQEYVKTVSTMLNSALEDLEKST